VQFEALHKRGSGELRLFGDDNFVDVDATEGTLAVDADASLTSQHTTLAAGATLRIDGAFFGTEGDDTFDAAGAVIGALAFGGGDDAVTFSGADVAGLTEFDGGAGVNDRIVFDGMALDGAALQGMAGFESMSLRNHSTLSLAQAVPLAGGLFAIDATSLLHANAGARIDGSLDNAGTVRVDGGRLAIAGDYIGSGGTLLLAVSPGTGTSGGLDIEGDVSGTTRVAFETDGTTTTQAASIKIIDSPNDIAGEGGFTAARDGSGFVRLPGSVLRWAFAQDAADGDWYLRTGGEDPADLVLLPEVVAYSVLPSIAQASVRNARGLAMDHLSSLRAGAQCGEQANRKDAAIARFDDCHGAWAAVTFDEIDVGADPGAAFGGDSRALYVGVDIFDREASSFSLRGGVFVGLQHGDYRTTGESSGPWSAVAASDVRTHTPASGAYASMRWSNGWHLDGTAVGQLHTAHVTTQDGFAQKIVGESLSLDVRAGRSFATTSGWTLDPRVQIGASGTHWRDVVDASDKPIAIQDEVLHTVRIEMHAERLFDTSRGRWQPWATLGLEETFGEMTNAVTITQAGNALRFPSHGYGLVAIADLGVDATISRNVAWFGSVSYRTNLAGSRIEQREATLGLRVRW
jgi:fibronectin-binding autotransporter adhesin